MWVLPQNKHATDSTVLTRTRPYAAVYHAWSFFSWGGTIMNAVQMTPVFVRAWSFEGCRTIFSPSPRLAVLHLLVLGGSSVSVGWLGSTDVVSGTFSSAMSVSVRFWAWREGRTKVEGLSSRNVTSMCDLAGQKRYLAPTLQRCNPQLLQQVRV